MKNPTLVILAAGMGSRYGGMKQIDGVGSHGEPIIEGVALFTEKRQVNLSAPSA